MSFDLTFPADSNTATGTGNTDGDLVTFSEDVTVTAVMVYATGWLSPRIYDGSTQALLASGPQVQPTDATELTRMPLTSSVVLTAGHPYLIAYFRAVSSPTTLVKQCTSVTSASASGTTMAASGTAGVHYGGSDAWPMQTQAGALLSLGVEATAASSGTAATAAGSLTLAGATTAAVRAAAAGTLVLAGAATPRAAAVASGVLALAGSATATAPFTLTVIPSGANALLSWPAAGASYVVERDGEQVAFGVTGTSYTDTPPAGEHTYRVGVLA